MRIYAYVMPTNDTDYNLLLYNSCGLEMQRYIDISPYRDTLSQWYSIGTI